MTAKTLPVRLEAVIFDWAGTLVDFGSFAPTKVFVDAFAQFGVEMSLEVARAPWAWASGTTSAHCATCRHRIPVRGAFRPPADR